MFYTKNLPAWERLVRVLIAAAMIGCGLTGLKDTTIGYVLIGAGAVSALTGFIGFCPMCAMAGRKLKSSQ